MLHKLTQIFPGMSYLQPFFCTNFYDLDLSKTIWPNQNELYPSKMIPPYIFFIKYLTYMFIPHYRFFIKYLTYKFIPPYRFFIKYLTYMFIPPYRFFIKYLTLQDYFTLHIYQFSMKNPSYRIISPLHIY